MKWKTLRGVMTEFIWKGGKVQDHLPLMDEVNFYDSGPDTFQMFNA